MSSRWIASRLIISGFIVFHLTATIVWVLPPCPVKALWMPRFAFYVIPLGLWQSWSMFAPDPVREVIHLESEVIDRRGMRRVYEFPRVSGLPWWRKLPRFRHPKFAANLLLEEFAVQRELTARHVVRQLGIPPEDFPLRVSLYYHVRDLPLPGAEVADPMVRSRLYSLAAFELEDPQEVWP